MDEVEHSNQAAAVPELPLQPEEQPTRLPRNSPGTARSRITKFPRGIPPSVQCVKRRCTILTSTHQEPPTLHLNQCQRLPGCQRDPLQDGQTPLVDWASPQPFEEPSSQPMH